MKSKLPALSLLLLHFLIQSISAEEDQIPEIEIWYGEEQRFSHLGSPQPLINILGSITPSQHALDPRFQLNNGRHEQMILGADLHRLAHDGDFNLEIERSRLRPGENTLVIRTRSPFGKDVTQEITILNEPATDAAKLPLEIDFSKVQNLQDVAEIVDGKWTLTDDGARTEEPYYDRQLAFGDMSWQDYELEAEIFFHHHFVNLEGRNKGGAPWLSHSHTSFNLRWAGHPEDGFLPRRNWQNLGSLVALRVDLTRQKAGSYWWLHFGRAIPGKPAKRSTSNNTERTPIEEGERYLYRLRVKTISETESRYSAKVWPLGASEPEQWQFQALDESEAVPTGSLMLVVHHSDVTLCRLRVTEL